ncbi:MAG: hypothetical protein ACLQVJ_06360 [Syntrophobacteraceae bacterium]
MRALDQSIDLIIRRLVRVGARVVYHARRWYVHVASAFSLSVTIAFYSPEPAQPHEGREASY